MISLTTTVEQHSANSLLEDFKDLDPVQPKLFRAARQDNHCISNRTGFVIRTLGGVDVALLSLRYELADRLSSIMNCRNGLIASLVMECSSLK